jgi:hypothetical protein
MAAVRPMPMDMLRRFKTSACFLIGHLVNFFYGNIAFGFPEMNASDQSPARVFRHRNVPKKGVENTLCQRACPVRNKNKAIMIRMKKAIMTTSAAKMITPIYIKRWAMFHRAGMPAGIGWRGGRPEVMGIGILILTCCACYGAGNSSMTSKFFNFENIRFPTVRLTA